MRLATAVLAAALLFAGWTVPGWTQQPPAVVLHGKLKPTHWDGCQAQTAGLTATQACSLNGVAQQGMAATVFVGLNTAASVSSMVDDKGDACTAVDTGTITYGTASFYCKNLTAGAKTFTATLNVAAVFGAIIVDVWSNINTSAPLDAHGKNAQTTPAAATDAITSGAVSTVSYGDLIVGATFATGTATGITAGTSYLPWTTLASNYLTESRIYTVPGSVAVTFTNAGASATWETFFIALKPRPACC